METTLHLWGNGGAFLIPIPARMYDKSVANHTRGSEP